MSTRASSIRTVAVATLKPLRVDDPPRVLRAFSAVVMIRRLDSISRACQNAAQMTAESPAIAAARPRSVQIRSRSSRRARRNPTSSSLTKTSHACANRILASSQLIEPSLPTHGTRQHKLGSSKSGSVSQQFPRQWTRNISSGARTAGPAAATVAYPPLRKRRHALVRYRPGPDAREGRSGTKYLSVAPARQDPARTCRRRLPPAAAEGVRNAAGARATTDRTAHPGIYGPAGEAVSTGDHRQCRST